jgi:hypothetical protein
MKKEYIVSLDISSDSLTLSELSAALGRVGDKTSSDKSDLDYKRELFGTTIWTIESTQPRHLPIEEHLKDLATRFPPRELQRVLPSNCCVDINIGVLYNADEIVAVGLVLTRATIEIVNAYQATIEIRCYPTRG